MGFSLEITTFVQKTTFRDEEGGRQRLHSFEKAGFLGFVGFSIGFTTLLLVFVGFSLEITTFAPQPTFRDEEGGGRVSIVLRKFFFLGFFGFSIGFTTSLLVFVGCSLEITTFAQKTTFRDEEGGRQMLQ